MNWKITILTRVKLVRSQFDGNVVQSRTFNIIQNVGFFRIGKYQRVETIRRNLDHQLHRKESLKTKDKKNVFEVEYGIGSCKRGETHTQHIIGEKNRVH